jgi:Spy/CpxP family protein refolding chaperone
MKHTALGRMIFIGFILVPIMAFGQDVPPGKWWHIPRVVKKLNLAETQVTQLDKAFYQSRLNLIQLKSDLEREQFELENRLENKTLDEKAALEQYNRLEQARSKLGLERFRFLLKIREIVGVEGFQELMSFKTMFQQRRRALRNREHPNIGKQN